MQPEWSEDDAEVDFDESLAAMDDRFWSWIVWRMPFRWDVFLSWWVARRYVQPRDVRRR